MRYKNWKFYYTMMGSTDASALGAPFTYKWTQINNIMRDPFEDAVVESKNRVVRWRCTRRSDDRLPV